MCVILCCDLELVEPRSEVFIDDYFVESEREFVRSALSGAARDLRTNLVWCAKESALKVVRQGLRRDTRSVVATIRGAEAADDWSGLSVLDLTSARTIGGWWRVTDGFVEVVTVLEEADPR